MAEMSRKQQIESAAAADVSSSGDGKRLAAVSGETDGVPSEQEQKSTPDGSNGINVPIGPPSGLPGLPPGPVLRPDMMPPSHMMPGQRATCLLHAKFVLFINCLY